MKLTTTIRKRFRVSNKLKRVASKDRLRLSISRSAKNISAQIIDDKKNITLLSASSVEKDIKSASKVNKTELSKIVAERLAKKAQEKKITKVFFDGIQALKIKHIEINIRGCLIIFDFYSLINIQNSHGFMSYWYDDDSLLVLKS